MITGPFVVWGAKPKGEPSGLQDRSVKRIRAKALSDGLRAIGIEHELRSVAEWKDDAIPSVSSGAPLIWRACLDRKAPFWAVDNGFWGAPAKGIDVNYCYLKMCYNGPIPRFRADADPDGSRFERFGLTPKPWRPNKHGHILLCPPGGGLASQYYGIVQEKWIDLVRTALPSRLRGRIRIRRKGDPGTIRDASKGALAVVSQASRVGFDVLLRGVPSIETAGMIRDWNGLSPEHIGRVDLCKSDRMGLFRYAAWCQFLLSEMRSGFAWEASFLLQCGGPGSARERLSKLSAAYLDQASKPG